MNNKQLTQFLAKVAGFPNAQIWVSADPRMGHTSTSCYLYPVYDGTWTIYNPWGLTKFPCMSGPSRVEKLSLEEVFGWVIDKETCKEELQKLLLPKLEELQEVVEAERYIRGI